MNVYEYRLKNRVGGYDVTKRYIVAESMDKAVWHIENKLGTDYNRDKVYDIKLLGRVDVVNSVPEVFIPSNFGSVTGKSPDTLKYEAISSSCDSEKL